MDSDSEIMEEYEEFMTKFPPNTKIISITGNLDEYEAELRCPCKTKQEFISWLRQLEKLSKNTYRVAITRPRVGKKVLFKAVYRCQHNTYPNSHQRVKTPHKKHTGCSAQLRVTIKSSEINRRVRTSDALQFKYPTLVTLINKHNHNVQVAEAFRDMSEDVKLKLIDLFRRHHPPARALKILKEDLLEEYGDEYFKVSADTSICPTIHTVYTFYYSVFKKKFGEEEETSVRLVELLKKDSQIKEEYKLLNQHEFDDTNVAEGWYGLSSDNSNKMDLSIISGNIKNEDTNMESLEAIDGSLVFNCEDPDPSFAANWDLLQERFNNLIDTWKTGSNSSGYYKGFEKTVSFFENCTTERAAISALHCVGSASLQSRRPLKKANIDHS